MRILRKLLTAIACVGVFHMGAALAADTPKPAAKDLVLKGDAKCTSCHDEADAPGVLHIGKTRHGVRADGRAPTCTDCHGDSEAHLGYKGSAKPPKPDRYFAKNSSTAVESRNEACLACHKNGNRAHWEGSQHANQDLACTSCHQVHTGQDKVRQKSTQAEVCFTCHKEQRAQANRLSHHPIIEGKVVCSDCHNAHGSTGPKLLVKNSINATCYTCHAEKRGPFLWEHAPATDDCSNCHTPHGSSNTPLLKSRTPYLCQECHQDHGNSLKGGFSIPNSSTSPAANSVTSAATVGKYLTVQGNGRMCVNCHVMVHGTNHPAGAVLTR